MRLTLENLRVVFCEGGIVPSMSSFSRRPTSGCVFVVLTSSHSTLVSDAVPKKRVLTLEAKLVVIL